MWKGVLCGKVIIKCEEEILTKFQSKSAERALPHVEVGWYRFASHLLSWHGIRFCEIVLNCSISGVLMSRLSARQRLNEVGAP